MQDKKIIKFTRKDKIFLRILRDVLKIIRRQTFDEFIEKENVTLVFNKLYVSLFHRLSDDIMFSLSIETLTNLKVFLGCLEDILITRQKYHNEMIVLISLYYSIKEFDKGDLSEHLINEILGKDKKDRTKIPEYDILLSIFKYIDITYRYGKNLKIIFSSKKPKSIIEQILQIHFQTNTEIAIIQNLERETIYTDHYKEHLLKYLNLLDGDHPIYINTIPPTRKTNKIRYGEELVYLHTNHNSICHFLTSLFNKHILYIGNGCNIQNMSVFEYINTDKTSIILNNYSHTQFGLVHTIIRENQESWTNVGTLGGIKVLHEQLYQDILTTRDKRKKVEKYVNTLIKVLLYSSLEYLVQEIPSLGNQTTSTILFNKKAVTSRANKIEENISHLIESDPSLVLKSLINSIIYSADHQTSYYNIATVDPVWLCYYICRDKDTIQIDRDFILTCLKGIRDWIGINYDNEISTHASPGKPIDVIKLKNKQGNIDTIEYSFNYINADIDVSVFKAKIKQGLKPKVLMNGPTGAGKTQYIIELCKQLNKTYSVINIDDYSKPYMGEGEAEMTNIFKKAQDNDEVLIINEVDSLVSSREKTSNEHIYRMVNHTLNLIDQYDVIIFMSTNFIDAIDTAFKRRIPFIVKFDFLKDEHKIKIFKEVCAKLKIKLKPNEIKDLSNRLNKISLTPGTFKQTLQKYIYFNNPTVNDVIEHLENLSGDLFNKNSNPMGFSL